MDKKESKELKNQIEQSIGLLQQVIKAKRVLKDKYSTLIVVNKNNFDVLHTALLYYHGFLIRLLEGETNEN